MKPIIVDLVRSLARDLVRFVVAFSVGAGVGAMVCLYYGFPVVLSLAGGFAVLGVALALSISA